MTINIVLLTSDAVVFGCDSLSSANRPVIDPFSKGINPALDASGSPILDDAGNHVYSLRPENVSWLVTDVFGGVNKMFPLYHNGETTVAAVTNGLAELEGKPIAEIVRRYHSERCGQQPAFNRVEDVAADFCAYVVQAYQQHLTATGTVQQYATDLNFLVAGLGADDAHPSVYRLSAKANVCSPQFVGGNYGIAWGGIARHVERLLMGFDSHLKRRVEETFQRDVHAYQTSVVTSVMEAVNQAGLTLPPSLALNIPPVPVVNPGWTDFETPVNFRSLPPQYAVDLVSFLVTAEAGMERFANGIATVGGRTHVGYIRAGKALEMLNEPTVTHTLTGFSDDD
jgi:hypothetical protein